MIILIAGCTPFANREQKEFVSALGTADNVLLEKLIHRMELHLQETYATSNVRDAYREYFKDHCAEISSLEVRQEHCETLTLFATSQLGFQYRRMNYDTVYVADGHLMTVQEGDTNWTIMREWDSPVEQVEAHINSGYLKFDSSGNLFTALEKIQSKSDMLSQYLERKTEVGHVNPWTMSDYLFRNQIDITDDYVMKSIVFVEIYLHELERSGC